MGKIAIVGTVLTFLFGPLSSVSAQQAQPVFLNYAEVLGVCNGKVIFYGERKPGVHNGIYSTDGKAVRLIRDFFDFNSTVDNVWQGFPQHPQLIGPVPLRIYKNRSHTFVTVCDSVASIKTVQRNFYPEFRENYVVKNNKLIFGRVSRSSTEVVELSNNRLKPWGVAPSKQSRADRDGSTRLYGAKNGILFEVADSKTTRRALWTTNGAGARILSDFPEVVAAGYPRWEVRGPVVTGDESVFFGVYAQSTSGSEKVYHYVTDGETTEQVTYLPPLTRVRDVFPLQSVNGALVSYEDFSRPTTSCKLGLVSFAHRTFQDITAALGNLTGLGMWCYGIAAKTSKGSLFFAHEKDPNRLMRLNLNTLQLSQLIVADDRISGIWFFRDVMYFEVNTPSGTSKLYSTDGTPEGTRPVTVGGRSLLGTEIWRALFHRGSVYLAGYTRANGDSLIDYGLYRFTPPTAIQE